MPTDGIIVKGQSSFDESMLTGESRPVDKGEGQEAVGGAVNGEGAVTLEVKKTGDQTYLSQVIDMVQARPGDALAHPGPRQPRRAVADLHRAQRRDSARSRSGSSYGQSFEFALERMVTVMVITCPHALGLAVPLVVAVSTKLTAQNGLLIRDRAAFERARKLERRDLRQDRHADRRAGSASPASCRLPT